MPSGVYKKSPEHIAKLQKGLEAGRAPAARAKASATLLRSIAADPAWRVKVSEATKAAMHQPDVRERHLAKLPKAGDDVRHMFKNGNGQPVSPLVSLIGEILTQIGFVKEFAIATRGHGTAHKPPDGYKADFANLETMTVIELDSPMHNTIEQQRLDKKKNEVLGALGWKVIRIKHKQEGCGNY
jgi:hypothetical protein